MLRDTLLLLLLMLLLLLLLLLLGSRDAFKSRNFHFEGLSGAIECSQVEGARGPLTSMGTHVEVHRGAVKSE